MNNNPLPTTVLVLAPAALQAQCALQLRASGSSWSTVPLQTLDTLDAVLREARAASPHTPLPLLLALEGLAQSPQDIYRELAALPHLAPLLLSDSRGAIGSAQDAGVPVSAPQSGISPSHLSDLLSITVAMTELRLKQQVLVQQSELAENRFRDMADQFADWLWEVDTSLRITFSSSRKRPAQGATRGSAFTGSFLPEERLRIEDDFAELIRSPRAFHDRDYWAADPYGTRVCWSVSGTPVYLGGPSGQQLMGFRGIARDVSPMKIATDQLYYLTNHDPLTGLANRHRFAEELSRTLRMAGREQRSGALVLLDLDHFALINHTHGHHLGDKALVHFAQILKDNVRTNDLVARLDGDLFALILRDVRPADLSNRLERLQATLAARPLPLEDGTLTLNASGGVSFYPDHASDHPGEGRSSQRELLADDLHANALSALRLAKQRGPNRLEVYDSGNDNDDAVAQRLEWVEFLNTCLAAPEERMLLHFQPIIPLIQGQHGPSLHPAASSSISEFYEVLIRLRDDTGQSVPAQQYFQIAEDSGFAPQIDRIVSKRALGLLKTWWGNGRRVRLSINLSARSVDDPTFLPDLLAMLAEAQLPPGAVVFELTETTLLKDISAAKTLIRGLREHGAGFALDDCGVGYSSLQYLRELDLDYVKIDGSFIRNLHTSPEDQAVVKALISIAKQKRIATIAEMVEHAAALEMIKTLEIDFGQGFYFAPPGPDANLSSLSTGLASLSSRVPSQW